MSTPLRILGIGPAKPIVLAVVQADHTRQSTGCDLGRPHTGRFPRGYLTIRRHHSGCLHRNRFRDVADHGGHPGARAVTRTADHRVCSHRTIGAPASNRCPGPDLQRL